MTRILDILNGNRTERSPSRSVIILDEKKACYQLIKILRKFEKETGHRLYVFIKTKNSLLGEMRDSSAHMTRSVHSHRHDALTVPLTVLLHCSITNMTRTLSYYCSNRPADDN